MKFCTLPIQPPSEEDFAEGAKYVLARPINKRSLSMNYGEVHDETGDTLWTWNRTWRRGSDSRWWWPTFSFESTDSKRHLTIRRSSFLPSSFEMAENGGPLGTIILRSPLRNRYQIRLNDGSRWQFHTPLFTVRFYCVCDNGGKIWGFIGPSEMQWNLLVAPGFDDPRILAAMAFLQLQRM